MTVDQATIHSWPRLIIRCVEPPHEVPLNLRGQTPYTRWIDTKMAKRKPPADPFAALYPNLATWVQEGYIELGRDDSSQSFIRVLDIGGLIWEGKKSYPTVHAGLRAADAAVAEWLASH